MKIFTIITLAFLLAIILSTEAGPISRTKTIISSTTRRSTKTTTKSSTKVVAKSSIKVTTKSSTKVTTKSSTKVAAKSSTKVATKSSTKAATKSTKTSTRSSSKASPKPSSSGTKSWSFANWNGNMKDEAVWGRAWGVTHWSYGEQNRALTKNPTDASETVLQVKYPKGSCNPASNPVGGTGFYAIPIPIPAGAPTVTFEYQVYFPANFNFVRGGKLPGLYGGHDLCSGGHSANKCFSTRMMWRKDGVGELYAYLPNKQANSWCKDSVICGGKYGDSLGRGSFVFKRGAWNKVRQTITPNVVPGKATGDIQVWFNDKSVMEFGNIDFRTDSKTAVVGIDFDTFFGGSDPSYNSPTDQHSLFRGFKLSVAS